MKPTNYFYRDDACDVFFNEEFNAVQTFWKGTYIQGEQFRKILNAIIDLIRIKNCHLVIADARQMKIISKLDQEWIINEWYPNAVEAGFAYEILIVAPGTFSEVTIKKIVTNHYDEDLVRTVYLNDIVELKAWVDKLLADEVK